ncbi:MAG TPA: tetratricopeptide repeat protein [Stenomitos sp.]
MQKQSRRWLTIAVLGFSSLVFIGLSIFPLIGGILSQNETSQTATNPNPSNPSAQASDSPESLKKDEEGYQLVLKRDPENTKVLEGLLETRLKMIRLGLRTPKDVVEPLQQLAKLNPKKPMYSALLAQAQQQSGDAAAASQTFQSALAQQPTSVEVLQGYVGLLLQQKQPDVALATLQKAIATGEQSNRQQAGTADVPALKMLLGDVYLSQKRDGDAIALYDQLRQENPNDFRPVVGKGIVLRNQGKAQEAVALFQTAITMAPVEVKDKIQQLMTGMQTTPNGGVTTATPQSSVSAPATSAPVQPTKTP